VKISVVGIGTASWAGAWGDVFNKHGQARGEPFDFFVGYIDARHLCQRCVSVWRNVGGAKNQFVTKITTN
jgi:hypothetical protein